MRALGAFTTHTRSLQQSISIRKGKGMLEFPSSRMRQRRLAVRGMSKSPLGTPSHRYVECIFGPRWTFSSEEALTRIEVSCCALSEQMSRANLVELSHSPGRTRSCGWKRSNRDCRAPADLFNGKPSLHDSDLSAYPQTFCGICRMIRLRKALKMLVIRRRLERDGGETSFAAA